MSERISRRRFLVRNAAAAGLGVAGAVGVSRRGWGRALAEPINVGLIGVGWRGGQLLSELSRLREVRIAALCDPDAQLLAQPSKDFPEAKTHADLRRVLDDSAIDAVVIATCNHWHCLAAVWACEAGKDVYVEKPLSHRLWEGRQLILAARKHGRIVQVGTQQRSDPMQEEIRALLHTEKALGEIQAVVATRFGIRESIGKRATPLEPPASVDYGLWLGPARDQPIYRDKLHYDWHWDWNTGNGECANWGVHILDDVRNVVFNDAVELPSRVACGGGRVVWNDAGDSPNLQYAYLEAGEIPVFFALSNLPATPGVSQALRFDNVDSGYVVHCEGGSYHGVRGRGVAFDPQGTVIKEFQGDAGAGHLRNFFTAVRERDASLLKADVAVGHASTNWSHVINAAYRAAGSPGLIPARGAVQESSVGDRIERLMREHLHAHFPEGPPRDVRVSDMLEIDAEQERFVGEGAAAANEQLGPRDYRAPYILNPVTA